MTNADLLEQMIEQSGIKKNALAKMLNITPQSLYNKIHNLTKFNQQEMGLLKRWLKLSPEDFDAIFFASEVNSK
jgi:plasmid maintenance system antidote protein VapI